MRERGIEERAHALLAVLARLGPKGRQDELVAAGQLLRLVALLGGVLQHESIARISWRACS